MTSTSTISINLPPPLVGSVINDRYEVREQVGEGGFGVVNKVYDRRLRCEWAMKIIRPDNPQDAERFRQESLTLATIDQENIIKVVDSGDLPDGRQFFVMQFLRGRGLNVLLFEYQQKNHSPPPPAVVLGWTEQVLAALKAAHKKGIIHRDLKPENIFLAEQDDGDKVIKLLDFGLAKDISAEVREGKAAQSQLAGTPDYLAPEQCTQGNPMTPATDMYALGATLFHLLSGEVPYRAESVAALMRKHLDAPVPHLTDRAPSIPVALSDFVFKLMQKEPAQRYASSELALVEVRRLQKDLREASTQQARLADFPELNLPAAASQAETPVVLMGSAPVAATTAKVSRTFSSQELERAGVKRNRTPLYLFAAVFLFLVAIGAYWAGSGKTQVVEANNLNPSMPAQPAAPSPVAAVEQAPQPSAQPVQKAEEVAKAQEKPTTQPTIEEMVVPLPAHREKKPMQVKIIEKTQPKVAISAASCIVNDSWKANVRKNTTKLLSRAAKDPDAYERFEREIAPAIMSDIDSASSSDDCARVELRIRDLERTFPQ